MRKEIEDMIGMPIRRLAALVLGGLLGLVTLCSSYAIVSPGNRGIVVTLGSIDDDVLMEGFHLKLPFVSKIKEVNVQTGKSKTTADSASKDLQKITTEITLNYRLDPLKVNTIYQKIGIENIEAKIIRPAVEESVKAVTARYKADELITERVKVSDAMKNAIIKKVGKFFILTEAFSITDFKFSETFSASIEAKQKAEQDSLRAENEVKRVKAEADAEIERARGEAAALRAKATQITPLMIQKEWVEKWDGKLPMYITNGSNVMMVNPGQ